VLQRERHGTLFTDNERKLDLYLRGLWQSETQFVPYSLAFDELRKPTPYLNKQGIHLPDVYDDLPNGTRGIDRYRALLAHLSAHQRWTTAIIADNLSPFQRMSIEVLRMRAWNIWRCRNFPACVSCGASCILCRPKISRSRKANPTSAIASRCCRARYSTRNIRTKIRRY